MARRIARFAAATAVALSAATVAASPAGPRTLDQNRVTLFGDSVAESLIEYVPARRKLVDGVDVDWEVEPCRRLAQQSCPVNGVRPPTVMDVIADKGAKLADNVIVAVGYNDFEDAYAGNIDDVVAALRRVGVKRVFWLTLRAAKHSYVRQNDAIVVAASKYPSMYVIDWNGYSRTHDEWFQDDGIHLEPDGADALATLLHQTLVQFGIVSTGTAKDPPKPPSPRGPAAPPLRVTTSALPVAHRGRQYTVRLKAAGGKPPYFWSVTARLPRGLSLRPTGWITGRPRGRPGAFSVTLRVRDVATASADATLRLRIRAR